MKNALLILSVALISTSKVWAGFTGSIAFTPEEKEKHKESITTLTNVAETCLKDDLNHHREFYKKYGISPFYGQNSAYSKLSRKERIGFLASKKLDPKLVDVIVGTSCVGLTLKCLEKGFKETDQAEVFKRLRAFTVANGVDGSSLQHGLRELGWKTLYWNPNPSKNKSWDFQEKLADPKNKKRFRGFHEDNYVAVKNKKRYYLNAVDDSETLINFNETEPAYLKNIPFFVATAHMGYHVFPGSYGIVTEAHSMRPITDQNTVESAPFNPLSDTGAPSGRYRSGMLSVPPGF